MTPATLDNDRGQALIAAAGAAPSLHNCQPWRFRLDPATRTVFVHALPQRTPRLTDPDTRAVHISVGAALGNLQAAAVHLGWEPVVRLLPRPEQPDLLATVRLAGAPRAALLRRPDLLADPEHGRCAPQMLLRIGYGPAGCPTPRLRAELPEADGRDHAAAPLAGSARP